MAHADYFLKLEGYKSGLVEGESTDSKHKNEIEILSWKWSARHPVIMNGPGAGSASGRVEHSPMQFTALVSKASPKLALACATLEVMKTATLTCRKAGTDQQEFLHVVLTDAVIFSYESHSGDDGVLPVDEFTLGYKTIEQIYKAQKADGSLHAPVKTGWHLKEHAKL